MLSYIIPCLCYLLVGFIINVVIMSCTNIIYAKDDAYIGLGIVILLFWPVVALAYFITIIVFGIVECAKILAVLIRERFV